MIHIKALAVLHWFNVFVLFFCKLDLEAGEKNGAAPFSCMIRSLAWLRLEWQICGECDRQMQIVEAAHFKRTHSNLSGSVEEGEVH